MAWILVQEFLSNTDKLFSRHSVLQLPYLLNVDKLGEYYELC